MGQTPASLPTLKKKSPTFSALFPAEGNVFVIYFFLSVSIKLSTRVVLLFFFFCRFSPSSSSSFDFFALGLDEPF